MAFWRTSKRFKALSDRSYYSYVVVKDAEACVDLAWQILAWTRSNSTPPSLVLGLTLHSCIPLDLSSTPSPSRSDPIELILALLPNLSYLNFGGSFAPSPKLHGTLASYPLSLRSVVGLGLTPSNYNSILVFLRSVSQTLRYLHLVDIETMERILGRLGALNPPIELPTLRSLRLVSDVRGSLGLGESLEPLPLWKASREGLAEFSCPSSWMERKQWLRHLDVAPRLETLAFSVGLLDDGRQTDADLGFHPRIRTLIALQEDTTSLPVNFETADNVVTSMQLFLSLATFPNLERVYWITETKGDHHFAWWNSVSIALAKAGVVEVICV